MARGEASALKTWAMVLGFLAVLMLALGGFGYFMKTMSAAHRPPQATALQAQTGGRH